MLDFYKGMDVSFIPELLEGGMKCYDFDGTTIEPLDLAKKYGVNAIRLRIWHTPSNVEESKGYCSLEHTIKMAKEIYARDLDFMLDFHYSDYWADPGKQRKPKAWEELSFEQFVAAHFLLSFLKEYLLYIHTWHLLIHERLNVPKPLAFFADLDLPNNQNNENQA